MNVDEHDRALRTALQESALSQVGRLAGDPLAAVEGVMSRRRRRRRAGGLLGIFALVACGTVSTAWLIDDDAAEDVSTIDQPVTVVPGPDNPSVNEGTSDRIPPVPGVEQLDAGPLSPRRSPAVVWLDTSLLVWGGENPQWADSGDSRTFDDGAVYEPTTGEWTSITGAPFMSSPGGAVAVWTGEEVIAFGETAAASWDPESGTWRRLGSAPGYVAQAVWTGDEVLTVGAQWSDEPPAWGALDPSTGEWRRLPDPPSEMQQAEASAWTGEELVVLGRAPGLAAAGYAYSAESDSWRELPPGPFSDGGLSAVWTGEHVVVVSYETSAARYDPRSDSWEPLPRVPSSFSTNGFELASDGEHTLAFGFGPKFIRSDAGPWRPIPFAGESTWSAPVAGGHGAMYQFGLGSSEPQAPNLFHRVDLEALARSRSVALSFGRLELPDDAELVSASGEGRYGAEVTIEVRFREAMCEFTAGPMVTPSGEEQLTVQPLDDSDPWTAHLDTERTSLFWNSVQLTCPTPELTAALARHLWWPPDTR